MKKIILTCLLYNLCIYAGAQKQSFDLATFTPPPGWKKQNTESAVQFTKEDAVKGTYCALILLKAVPGSADPKTNFDAAWETVIKEMVTVSTTPEMQSPATENGWEVQTGYAPFESDGTKGIVMLVTETGFDKMMNLVIMTNTDLYEKDISAFLGSITLKKPLPINNKPFKEPIKPSQTNTIAKQDGFMFTTTNFDDGWTSTVQEDWVEVKKGTIKIFIHYPK